jgi:hypothetical protein
MTRVICAAVLAAGLMATTSFSSSFKDDEKVPSIKVIMGKAHKGGDSLIQRIGKDLKSDNPDWSNLQKMS